MDRILDAACPIDETPEGFNVYIIGTHCTDFEVIARKDRSANRWEIKSIMPTN